MNEKGFTLVEVVVSIALVGILAITFIPILSAQYINIYKSGDKSKATYDAMEKVEERVSDPEVYKEQTGDVANDDIITFGDKEIDIRIKDVEEEGKHKEEKTKLKVGVPVDKK